MGEREGGTEGGTEGVGQHERAPCYVWGSRAQPLFGAGKFGMD